MRLNEACNRPGGGVLLGVLTDALPGQVNSTHKAQDILHALYELVQKKDMDEDWIKPETNEEKDTYDEVAAEFVAEDRSRTWKKKLYAKLDAEVEEYHKRKHDDSAGSGAASSSTTRVKRLTTEQPTPMDVDGTPAEVEVDYTEDTFEC